MLLSDYSPGANNSYLSGDEISPQTRFKASSARATLPRTPSKYAESTPRTNSLSRGLQKMLKAASRSSKTTTLLELPRCFNSICFNQDYFKLIFSLEITLINNFIIIKITFMI